MHACLSPPRKRLGSADISRVKDERLTQTLKETSPCMYIKIPVDLKLRTTIVKILDLDVFLSFVPVTHEIKKLRPSLSFLSM